MKGYPWTTDDEFHVAIVTPVVHYTMGGLLIDDKARVLNGQSKAPIGGLYCGGEAAGGVHGRNRLGGSALLECVVFGRKAGESVLEYLPTVASSVAPAGGAAITITIPQANGTSITVQIHGGGVSTSGASIAAPVSAPAPAAKEAPVVQAMGEFSLKEVAAHNKEDDCWVVVNGEVLDVTKFMHDHPGGKMAIMTFAGRDATHEFNMLHDKNVVEKYAPECVVGKLKAESKL